jgi:hypothetical protein
MKDYLYNYDTLHLCRFDQSGSRSNDDPTIVMGLHKPTYLACLSTMHLSNERVYTGCVSFGGVAYVPYQK